MTKISRRHILATGGAFISAALSAPAALAMERKSDTPAGQDPIIAPPKLEFAFRVHVTIGEAVELGVVHGGRKRMIPITGGTFEGPKIKGVVLPGGADWQEIRSDGVADILAIYALRADDGTEITVENPGFRHAPAPILEKLSKGEPVDPALYYFRTAPRLTVSENSPHAWLGKTVFTCTAARYSEDVILDYYAVL